jgi:hypothetical protein
LSASAPSHHNTFSAAFTTNIAESNFRYTQQGILAQEQGILSAKIENIAG